MAKHALSLVLLCFLLLVMPTSAQEAGAACAPGSSTEDREGCLDSDGDGWSDPDDSWNASMGADAFPNNASEHRDLDGDSIGTVSTQTWTAMVPTMPSMFGRRTPWFGQTPMATAMLTKGCTH